MALHIQLSRICDLLQRLGRGWQNLDTPVRQWPCDLRMARHLYTGASRDWVDKDSESAQRWTIALDTFSAYLRLTGE
jgi:hypothetical protein